MAVEKIKLMNLVIPKEDTISILRKLLEKERFELIDAKKTIDDTAFLLSTSLEHADMIQELNEVDDFRLSLELSPYRETLDALLTGADYEPKIDYLGTLDFQKISEVASNIESLNDELKTIQERQDKLKTYEILCKNDVDIPLKKLYDMEFMRIRIGSINPIAYQRLKLNAANIPPLFMRLGSNRTEEILLFIYPSTMEIETNRILQSLMFEELKFDPEYQSLSNQEILKIIKEDEQRVEEIYRQKHRMLEANESNINLLYTEVRVRETIEKLAPMIGSSEHYNYLSMWVPKKRVQAIKEMVQTMSRGIIGSMGSKEAQSIERVPTSLKNNWFFRPFEMLVYLYGIPNYREIDPTPFFALVYMLLFGTMFGDLGQGLVIFLVGLFLSQRVKAMKNAGELGIRIGLSSMIFGFFYDSFFGYEGVISSWVQQDIFIHPFSMTNTVLIAAVLLGLVLLSVSYVFSIYNKIHIRDYEEAFLGKNGVTGFILFLSILVVAAIALELIALPKIVFLILIILCILVLFFKEPLYHLIRKDDAFFEEGFGSYAVQSVFEVIETLLALFSNSMSFMRVGAFALNHVGLFIAFHTLADMIGGASGSISMGIIGNIIILGLEGLIVFIQGLRLMYYELFSKYFIGEGRPFQAQILEEK